MRRGLTSAAVDCILSCTNLHFECQLLEHVRALRLMHARTHARGADDAAARAYERHGQPASGFDAMLSARAKTVEGKGRHAKQRHAFDGAAGDGGDEVYMRSRTSSLAST